MKNIEIISLMFILLMDFFILTKNRFYNHIYNIIKAGHVFGYVDISHAFLVNKTGPSVVSRRHRLVSITHSDTTVSLLQSSSPYPQPLFATYGAMSCPTRYWTAVRKRGRHVCNTSSSFMTSLKYANPLGWRVDVLKTVATVLPAI